MVDAGGNWDWSRLEQLLPTESLERIASIQPPGNRVADRMAITGRMQRGLNATLVEVPMELRELIDAEKSQSAVDGAVSTTEGAIPYDPGGGTSFG
ncbi:hypothetical protein V6N11_020931 [Hibiscus sabdariffa]|uniref:Uncharacterized protein n=1 Tax=Hibiscus sabdariffa TaxID=183260 RepID=A0ABR2Q9U2_9ROSI